MNKLSIDCFFKGSFSKGIISILSRASMMVFSSENIVDIILVKCSILFFLMNKLSINCIFKGSFSKERISKFSLASIDGVWGMIIFLLLLINKLSTNCLVINFLSSSFLFKKLFNLLFKSFNSFSFLAKANLSCLISSSYLFIFPFLNKFSLMKFSF